MTNRARRHTRCPWYMGWLLLTPWRRRSQDPAKIFTPFVREGMTVLEPGPGMGFFTLELARQVGPSGRIVAVDIQPKMLSVLKRRAAKNQLGARIETRLASEEGMALADLQGLVDFIFAFAVVHEMSDRDGFFAEASAVLKAGGQLLLAEPVGHVPKADFAAEVQSAVRNGLSPCDPPLIHRSQAALLRKPLGRA